MRRPLPVALLLASFATLVACSGGDSPVAPDTALTLATSTTEISSNVSALVGAVPSVTVRNSRGEGVSGVLVHWAVLSGAGRVDNDTVRTNGSGVASVGGWTLGPLAGSQQLQATVTGMTPVVFTATALATAPTRLVNATTATTSAVVGAAVSGAISVRAEDASGNPVAGVPVLFAVTAGGGSVDVPSVTTDARGIATVGRWTLGTTSGLQTLRATSSGLSAADVSLTATAAAPANIAIVAGDNQGGVPGAVLPQPPVVRVIDSYGNNVGGVPIVFTPGANSGTVAGATVNTDVATGTAVLGSWTLGSAATQTLVASSAMLSGKSVTFRATLSSSQFDIDVRFIGEGGTERQRQAFTSAVTRWRQVITGDIGSALLDVPAGECASWIPAIKETINDLVIYVRLASIDGAGKVLGQASPCYVNADNKLPIMGFFELDVDDLTLLLNQGTLDNVVLHEMGHILGVGTLWSYQRSLLVGRGSEDPYFNGIGAVQQFASIGGNSYTGSPVPVENSGSAGTRDAHWRRSVFTNELMQGYAQPGGMPMSRVTIASLADLGYNVSFSSADSYSFFPSLRTLPVGTAVSLGDDVAKAALWEVQRKGGRRRVREAQ